MNVSKPILTIAIPTYRRGYVIERTVLNVLSEVNPIEEDVEILVCDNASGDSTVDVIKQIQKNHKVKLVVHKENIGADENFNACVANASGEYVWILGSDDLLNTGSVKKAIEVLSFNSGIGGVSVNYGVYSRQASNKKEVKIFTPEINKNVLFSFQKIDINKRNFSKLYLGYFPFISSLIVRRENYLNAAKEVPPAGSSGYDFVGILLNVFACNGSWCFIKDELVKCMREPSKDDFEGFYGPGSWYAFEINSYLWRIIESDCRYGRDVKKSVKNMFFWRYIVGDLIRLNLSGAPADKKKEVLEYMINGFGASKFQKYIGILIMSIRPGFVKTVRFLKNKILR